MMATIESYMIAYIALTGVFITPLFVLWCVSLCLGRRKGDPARIGFIPMKIVFPFIVIALILFVVSEGLSLAERYESYYSSFNFKTAYIVSTRASVVGTLFERLANVALLITQVEIGIGFLYVLAQGRDKLQTTVRYAALAVASLLFILVIACFGQTEAAWEKYFKYAYSSTISDSVYDKFLKELDTARKLSAAVDILFWIAYLPLLAFASLVMHRVNPYPLLRNSCVLFLVSVVLNFIRHLWGLIYTAIWLLDRDGFVPQYVTVLQPLLDVWLLFVLLVLIFTISVRKHKGLWTNPPQGGQVLYMPSMQPPQGTMGPGGLYAAPPMNQQGQPMYQQGQPVYQQGQPVYQQGQPMYQQGQPMQYQQGAPAQYQQFAPQEAGGGTPQPYPQMEQQQQVPREVSPVHTQESGPPAHELSHVEYTK